MRRLAGDVRVERLRNAVAAATTPSTRLLVLVGLCAALWLLTGSDSWRGGAASQHLSTTDAACQAAAEVDDGSPMLPSRNGAGGHTAKLLRPWVQQAQDELSGLSEHVMQLRCGRRPADWQNLIALTAHGAPARVLLPKATAFTLTFVVSTTWRTDLQPQWTGLLHRDCHIS